MNLQFVKEGLQAYGDMLDVMVAEGGVEQLAVTIRDTLAIAERAMVAGEKNSFFTGAGDPGISSSLRRLRGSIKSLSDTTFEIYPAA